MGKSIIEISADIAGQVSGGACAVPGAIPETKSVTARSYLKCKQGHAFVPGDTIYMRHGTTICPICGSALRIFTPEKLRSGGKGRGLAIGRGMGPIGRRVGF